MDLWLNEDLENVVAVHCLAGRGRTGTVIAAYLLYIRMFSDHQKALEFFAQVRSNTEEGVNGPSQIRCVANFNKLLQASPARTLKEVKSSTLIVKQMIFDPLPVVEFSAKYVKMKLPVRFTPVVKIYSLKHRVKLYSTPWKKNVVSYRKHEFSFLPIEVNCLVHNDTEVKVYHMAKNQIKFSEIIKASGFTAKEAIQCLERYPLVQLFRFTFHTSFIDNLVLTLKLNELDAIFAGPVKTDLFPPSFTVQLLFDHPRKDVT
eukprot:TRINITY_DN3526_c0_g1_i2.p1 TRINITY_DN3526_c0_g1~~TRINITY_DN3526_c0_g1_i2.p1  ORF type:complete len:260 (-),score=37.65 TRINITY_DN3526_c0_g1_i2:217-996(-)